MPQLDPTYFPSQLLWLVISFLAVYLIMAKWGLPKVGEVLDERQNLIDGYLEKAAALQEETESLLKAHDAKIHEARTEAVLILKAKNDALALEYAQKYAEIESTITEQLKASEMHIAAQKEAFFKEIPGLAQKIAGDILTKIDASANQNDLEDIIKNLAKARKNVH